MSSFTGLAGHVYLHGSTGRIRMGTGTVDSGMRMVTVAMCVCLCVYHHRFSC